jgi:transposase InsO family protein
MGAPVALPRRGGRLHACLALVAYTSISRLRVAREFDRLMVDGGKSKTILGDNSTELTSNAILQWADDHKVVWHYIAPAKPVQNAFIESFIGRMGMSYSTRRYSARSRIHASRSNYRLQRCAPLFSARMDDTNNFRRSPVVRYAPLT